MRVGVSRPGEETVYRERATVEPGDVVGLRTQVLPDSSPGRPLEITVDKGPSSTLRIQAGPKGGDPVGSATLRTEDGSRVSLALSYKCRVEMSTFCPLESTDNPNSFVITKQSPSPEVPITLIADIRPPAT